MAQLKNLVVTGKSRFIGTVYADDIIGNVTGVADEAILARNDILNQKIDATYIKNISVSGRTITFTRGDGSTVSFQTQDTTYAQATDDTLGLVKIQASTGTSITDVMTQKATTDAIQDVIDDKVSKSDGIVDASVDHRTITFTRGDGSTFSFNTQDTTYAQATSATLGLVKLYENSGTYTDGTMTQKAIGEAIDYAMTYGEAALATRARKDINGKDLNTYGASLSVNGRDLSLLDSNGNTVSTIQTQDTTYAQATSATLGLVKIQANTGTSTADVMTQKAVTDELNNKLDSTATAVAAIKDTEGQNITSYLRNASSADRVVTFTKGDGSTFSLDLSYAQATSATLGLVKIQAATGTSITDVMTQKATTDALVDLKNTLEEELSRIFTAVIVESYEDLPPVGDSKYLYLVPTGESGGNVYDEYIWVVDDEDTGEGHYELFGVSTIDLDNYYTIAEADLAIASATDNNVVNITSNGLTVTFTKKNGSTGSFQTQDTTYTDYTAATSSTNGVAGLVPAPSSGEQDYVLTGGNKWAAKAPNAVNADTATYAVNAGTATEANHAATATIAVGDSIGQQIDSTYIKNASVSGRTVTFTKGDDSTFSFQTQDTTYTDYTPATTSSAGESGLIPAPTTAQVNYFLTGAGWKTNVGTAAYSTNSGTATVANSDSIGQQINTTYIKNASVNGTTVTFTKGDGSTFSFQTQDNNTTYANMGNATSSTAGTAGLVPAPSSGQQNYFLTGSGWKTNVGTSAYATKAGTATEANHAATATNADTATSAVNDSAGNNINTTYIKDASVSGQVVTFTKGDNSTFNITTQDNNTTYAAFTSPTASVAGKAGLVPAPASNTMNYILTASGWSNTASAAYATNAGTATHANDAITTATVSGRVVTFTKGDTSTFSITTQDNNTTYSLGNNNSTIVLTPSSGSTTSVSLNDLINGLSSGTAAPGDNDYFISQFAGGGTTTTTYHRRPVSALFNYMKGKFGTAAQKNIATSGNASTAEVVMGNDTRLTDSRNAKDVYTWAKAATKPSYTASEVGAIDATLKGVANGVAELDANGLVPSSQLPAYVDDVLEYATYADFPSEGTSGKIYVDLSTNLTYRWGGSAYVEISPSLALGETSSTAYRGDYGKTAYTHATDPNRLTTAKSSGFYKFAATSYGHVKSVTTVTKADITALGIPEADTHFTSHMYAGTGTANNASSTNGNTKLTIVDDTTVRDNITIKGTGGTDVTSNDSGVITVNSKNSMTGSYTPDGNCTGGDVELNTTDVPNITGVGTLPTCTFPTVSLSVNANKELSITNTGASFSQGTLPSTGTAIKVATSIKKITQPTFSGTASTVTVS